MLRRNDWASNLSTCLDTHSLSFRLDWFRRSQRIAGMRKERCFKTEILLPRVDFRVRVFCFSFLLFLNTAFGYIFFQNFEVFPILHAKDNVTRRIKLFFPKVSFSASNKNKCLESANRLQILAKLRSLRIGNIMNLIFSPQGMG